MNNSPINDSPLNSSLPNNSPPYCYCTLLGTDDYLPAVLGLYFSHQATSSIYPLIVIVPSYISPSTTSILSSLGVHYIVYPFIELNSDSYKAHGPEREQLARIAMQKFLALKLTSYEKVFFLDADVIIYENIDSIFDFSFPCVRMLGDNDMYAGEGFGLVPSDEIYNEFIKKESAGEIFWDQEAILKLYDLNSLTIIPEDYFSINKNNSLPTIFHSSRENGQKWWTLHPLNKHPGDWEYLKQFVINHKHDLAYQNGCPDEK